MFFVLFSIPCETEPLLVTGTLGSCCDSGVSFARACSFMFLHGSMCVRSHDYLSLCVVSQSQQPRLAELEVCECL